MTANDKLYVEVLDDEIIITLPGTNYAVTYYRATAFPQRLAPSPTREERITMPQ